MAVHGHYMTMNMKFSKESTDELWEEIAVLIRTHNVNFLVGDWNMSLPQVIPRLKEKQLVADCCC